MGTFRATIMYISTRHISAEEIWHTNLKGWIHLKSFRSADGAVRTYLDLPLSLVREHTHPPHTIYPAIKFRKIFKWISVHHQWKKLDKTVCSRYIGYLHIYIVYLWVHYKPLRIYTRIRTYMHDARRGGAQLGRRYVTRLI